MGEMMVKAVCVSTGTKYPPEYANRLARGLLRNGYKGKLYCFTDNPSGFDKDIVEPVIIPEPRYSWWDKLYLYSWEHRIRDSLLGFDLDMIITGDIGCFLEYNSRMCTGSRFDDPRKINSTLVRIPYNFGRDIWLGYCNRKRYIEKVYDWDSKYLDAVLGNKTKRWQDLFPDSLVSYKLHVRKYGLKPENKVVSFHGKPDPHEVGDEFVRLHWK